MLSDQEGWVTSGLPAPQAPSAHYRPASSSQRSPPTHAGDRIHRPSACLPCVGGLSHARLARVRALEVVALLARRRPATEASLSLDRDAGGAMVAGDTAVEATLRLGCGRAAQFGGGASQAEQAGGLRKPLLLCGFVA